jgi:hypothetical protein
MTHIPLQRPRAETRAALVVTCSLILAYCPNIAEFHWTVPPAGSAVGLSVRIGKTGDSA